MIGAPLADKTPRKKGRMSDEVAAAIAGELELLEPHVRRSRSRIQELLDPEFTEIGASGRRWSYAETLEEVPGLAGAAEDGPQYEASGMSGVRLAPGVVHLTYETNVGGRRARRSSIWRTGPDGRWRMYYHQGTPVPDESG